MEQWESLLANYPASPDLKIFRKAIRIAEKLLQTDLAEFEMERILETLLYKPVDLLNVLARNHMDETWRHPIGESFKLLADTVTRHPSAVTDYCDHIIRMSLLPFDSEGQKHAFACLEKVVRVHSYDAKAAIKHVEQLEVAEVCKSQLALLVGSICQYRSELVQNEMIRIWRIYLKMLEVKNNTDTLLSAILQGLSGLFHSFGKHLPTSELSTFYDILVKCFHTSKCETVVITILEKYSDLFKERLTSDTNIRVWLWNTIREKKDSEAALRSIYEAISTILSKDSVQNILNNEVMPKTEAADINTRFTALRLLVHMHRKNYSFGDLARFTDIHTLEFQLRCGTISYSTAEEISWCIESNLPNSDKLLQTAILFSSNLPASKRVDMIANGILNATDDVRKETIVFLTTESIQPSDNGDSIHKYMDVWTRIVAGSSPGASKVVEDYVAHVIFVLDMFLEEGIEAVPPRVSSLLALSARLLLLPSPLLTAPLSAALLPRLVRCEAAEAVLAITTVARCVKDTNVEQFCLSVLAAYCKGIEITRCKDEATLCATCLLLLRVESDSGQLLAVLQIIFSRSDVDTETQEYALCKLEYLMEREREFLDQTHLDKVLHLVDKLRTRIDLTHKGGRVLHRKIIMFLGRYGRKSDVNNNSSGDWVIGKLKNRLSLNIPFVDRGSLLKINLQSVVEIAIEEGDADILLHILTIICADPTISSDPESNTSAAIARLCQALCGVHAAGAPVPASVLQAGVLVAGGHCLQHLLQFISEETSPGTRKILSELLSVLLQSDDLLQTAAEQALVMVTAADSITRRAGLDLTEIVLRALTTNDSLTKTLLPQILELTSSTNELETKSIIDIAARTYIEKIALFDISILNELIERIVVKLLVYRKLNTLNDVGIYRSVCEKIIGFMKEAICIEKEESTTVFDLISKVYKSSTPDIYQFLYLLAIVKKVIGFESSFCSNVLTIDRQGESLLDIVYCLAVFEETNRLEPDLFRLEAVLLFFEEYAECLLELNYKKTVEFLSKIIKELTPHHVISLDKRLKSCLNAYKSILKSIPSCVQTSFEEWCQKLELKKITSAFNRNCPSSRNVDVIKSLRILLNALELKPLLDEVKSWPKTILGCNSKFKICDLSFLTDCLTVAVKYLTDADVKRLISEGAAVKGAPNELAGVKFCSRFIEVFLPFLKRLLLEPGMEDCCIVLHDVVMYYVMKRSLDECDVLELVDKLWPVYVARTTFHQKHRLLYNMARLTKKLGPESNPMRWVADQLAADVSRECKISLVSVLPSGEGFSACYNHFASSCLPATLREVRGPHAALRAALDALAATADRGLMGIVIAIAGSDDTKGWWDEAMDSCAASLARLDRSDLYEVAYTRCWNGQTLGVCQRIMVPLLRYSTAAFCERFFSTKIEDLLAKLRLKPRMASEGLSNLTPYKNCLLDRIRALCMLQVAFEKISLQSLQSPQSVLYTQLAVKEPSYLIREACKLCVTLRGEECPTGADHTLKAEYKLFQYSLYKCLCAAICKLRPGEKFYDPILSCDAWDKITDEEAIYELPIIKSKRKTRHSVSIEVAQTSNYLSTSTVRTRMFLRTLSEDPLNYDLFAQEDTQIVTQELELVDNALSRHPCAGTLAALVSHVSAYHSGWVCKLVDGLTRCHVNMRWLLAQVIINCKDDVKQHASVLRPALLELVAKTPREEGDKKTLNGLHVDILDILTQWREDTDIPESSRPHLNTAIELLIRTSIDTGERYLLDVLDRMVEIHARHVTLGWSCFSEFMQDSLIKSHRNKNSLSILKRLTKHKIRIPELVPTLVKYDQYWVQEHSMAEMFGMALALESDKDSAIRQFNKILDRARQNIDSYVKILYYAQQGCPNICDERHFRIIVDQTPKVQKQLKTRCFHIISVYISQKSSTDDHITLMFEAIELSELLSSVDNVEVLSLVGNGLHLMDDGLKRRVVMQVAEYCLHTDAKIRGAAYGVMVKAFEDLLNNHSDAPPTKKAKRKPTEILNFIYSDTYAHTVLSRVANTRDVATEVVSRLSSDIRIRLAECLLLCVYMPLKNHQLPSPNTQLLEMLFSELRSRQQFLAAKLRDEPLSVASSTSDHVSSATLRLLTKSAMCQGTFRSYLTAGYRGGIKKIKEVTDSGIDVQIQIDNILGSLLKFAKYNIRVQEALIAEILKALPKRPGFDLCEEVAEQLSAMLKLPAGDVTPLLVRLARVVVDSGCRVEGFYQTVEKLREVTYNTEGEYITACLLEEMRIRCLGMKQFVLGSCIYDNDVHMRTEPDMFSLKDVIECFGKLSNWDDLTSQQKDLQTSNLPRLWTDVDTFEKEIQAYTVTKPKNWFDKMLSVHNKCQRDTERWLNDTHKWPSRTFDVSAMIEATTWDSDQTLPVIQPNDCIVEWALRLQLRYVHHLPSRTQDVDSDSPIDDWMPSLSDVLLWCQRANEMALPELALQCVRRCEKLWNEYEEPMWNYQKWLAERAIALKQNNTEHLNFVLRTAETSMSDLSENCILADNVRLLVMKLYQDLNSLSYDKVQDILNNIDTKNLEMSVTNRRTLESIYELAMNHYSDAWSNEDSPRQNELLQNMVDVLQRVASSNPSLSDIYLAVILNKLAGYNVQRLEESVARSLLFQLHCLLPHLDEFSREQIKAASHMFPPRVLDEYDLNEIFDDSIGVYKKYFALVRDPRYSIKQYCCELKDAAITNDSTKYEAVFARIRELLDNPYAGTTYQLLRKQRELLYSIPDLSTPQSDIRKILSEVRKGLDTPTSSLRLSQLCPALTRAESGECERDRCIARLLSLGNLRVVKFEEQVSVILDSVRRPAVMGVRLSSGARRRLLHKAGEPLRTDAASQRAARILGGQRRGYTVTPTCEDSGLIEFLEDHEKLYELISSKCDLNDVKHPYSTRAADDELILRPSVEQFQQFADKVPAYLLRSALEDHSTSLQDFIVKKRNFQDTLATATVHAWILGLGDRHLENILCSTADGAVCCIDWGAAFQFGSKELPATRLTRNMLAVCDLQVLESRIQKVLSSLRESYKLFTIFIEMSFKWMGEEFDDKLEHIRNILSGSALSYHVTRSMIESTAPLYKDHYLKLLDEVFQDFVKKDQYSIVEQVTCLLRHSTDPRILSVTRTNWDPWV